MEEEKYTQKEPQNDSEKTTQSTPARTRTRNSNINESLEANNSEIITALEAVETKANADAKTADNGENKSGNKRGLNNEFIQHRAPTLKSYAECASAEEQERLREERAAAGRKGAAANKANASVRKAMLNALSKPYAGKLREILGISENEEFSNADAVGARSVLTAIEGEDKNSVKAADLITKVTGEQVQQVDLNANVRTVANWRERPPKAEENGDNSGDSADPMP